jgi:hypothetical protein
MFSVILAFILAILPIKIHAQESQNAYIQSRNTYQLSLVDYTEKSQVYEKYNTITTRNDKFSSLKQALIDRNKMLSFYISALRVNLDKYKTVNSETTQKLQENLLNWENWLIKQNQTIQPITNETDLQNWTNQFNEKYPEIQKQIYTSLVVDEINRDLITLNKINEIINEVKSKPDLSEENKVLFNQIQSQSDTVSDSMKKAYDFTQQDNSYKKFTDIYDDSLDELNNAQNNLLDMSRNLRLLVTKTNG